MVEAMLGQHVLLDRGYGEVRLDCSKFHHKKYKIYDAGQAYYELEVKGEHYIVVHDCEERGDKPGSST
jgi:hypothetical protein